MVKSADQLNRELVEFTRLVDSEYRVYALPIGNWLWPERTHTKLPLCEVAVYWDVRTVKPMSDYRIYVEVEDGRKGIFDLKPYLMNSQKVFSPSLDGRGLGGG